jgi:hypothetical protein
VEVTNRVTNDDPMWDDAATYTAASDEDLVTLAGLAGYRKAPAGIYQPAPQAFRAQAELTRRLTEELRTTRASLERSSPRLECLTWVLVVLAVLTIGVGVLQALT